jgi:hypothetical protein
MLLLFGAGRCPPMAQFAGARYTPLVPVKCRVRWDVDEMTAS